MKKTELTISMATFDDFDGVFFFHPVNPNAPRSAGEH
jgi:hypothetical protein